MDFYCCLGSIAEMGGLLCMFTSGNTSPGKSFQWVRADCEWNDEMGMNDIEKFFRKNNPHSIWRPD